MKQRVFERMTLADIEALEERTGQRYELWQGQPVAMTGGTAAHNLVALGAYRAVHGQLKANCRAFVADVKLRLDEADDSDTTYPDVMVICDPLTGNQQTRPVLIAEVLSDSSVRRDRVDKRAAYTALESLQVYMILSQQDVEVDIYQRANQWQRERYQGLEAKIELTALEMRLALRDIYAEVLVDLGY